MKSFCSHLSLFLLISVLIILQACNGGEEMTENAENETQVIPVEVSNVSRGNISAYYSNTATLEAEQEATVVSTRTY